MLQRGFPLGNIAGAFAILTNETPLLPQHVEGISYATRQIVHAELQLLLHIPARGTPLHAIPRYCRIENRHLLTVPSLLMRLVHEGLLRIVDGANDAHRGLRIPGHLRAEFIVVRWIY